MALSSELQRASALGLPAVVSAPARLAVSSVEPSLGARLPGELAGEVGDAFVGVAVEAGDRRELIDDPERLERRVDGREPRGVVPVLLERQDSAQLLPLR